MGKKDTCPVCSEKVDLKAIFADRPWETTNLNWNQMLDMVSLVPPEQAKAFCPFDLSGQNCLSNFTVLSLHYEQRSVFRVQIRGLKLKILSHASSIVQIRYLVVWNPLILMGLHFTLHFLGLEKAAASPAAAPAPLQAMLSNLTESR